MSQPAQEAVNTANSAAQPNNGPAAGEATKTETQGTETGTAGTKATGTSTETDDGRGSKDAILADLATERDRRQAAEKQAQDVLKAVQTALGIKSETDDPQELAKKLTAAQAETTGAQLQLAIYRSSAAKDADVDALLDSLAFQNSVAKVDPSDAKAVEAAIKQFVDQNPRFKVTAQGGGTAPVVPGAKDLAQGNGSGAPSPTMDALLRGR